MTWAEFCIRLHAYHRIDKKEWYKTRIIAYQVYLSGWQDSKKKPLTINKFLPLDDEVKPTLTEAQLKAIKRAKEQYNKKVNVRTA